MKKILLLLMAVCTFLGIKAQENNKTPLVRFSPKLAQVANKISIHTTISTTSFSTKDISRLSLKDLRSINLGELTIAYKVNDRLSYGISNMNALSNPNSGYYNAENQFVSFCEEDDDHDDDYDDYDDYDDDLDDINDIDDHDDDDCDDDDGFGENIMGSVTFKLSDKLPFFVQAAGGYSFTSKAPAYTAKIGYNQKLFAGFGVSAGVRFSDVLHKLPVGAISLTPSQAVRAELGLNWNF